MKSEKKASVKKSVKKTQKMTMQEMIDKVDASKKSTRWIYHLTKICPLH